MSRWLCAGLIGCFSDLAVGSRVDVVWTAPAGRRLVSPCRYPRRATSSVRLWLMVPPCWPSPFAVCPACVPNFHSALVQEDKPLARHRTLRRGAQPRLHHCRRRLSGAHGAWSSPLCTVPTGRPDVDPQDHARKSARSWRHGCWHAVATTHTRGPLPKQWEPLSTRGPWPGRALAKEDEIR